MEQPTDIECVIKTLERDTNAFGILVERYSPRIRSLVGGIVGQRADADDLTQEIFVQAWTKLSTFRRRSLFSTWLYRIAYNTSISALRRRRVSVVEMDYRHTGEIEDETDEYRFSDADIDSLARAMERLRPAERVAVEMFYRDGSPLAEVAKVLGTTEGNAKVILFRARKRLGDEMTR